MMKYLGKKKMYVILSIAIGLRFLEWIHFFAMDPENRHLGGNNSFMYRQLFFTCAFHGPPSGIQVSLSHSPVLGLLQIPTFRNHCEQRVSPT